MCGKNFSLFSMYCGANSVPSTSRPTSFAGVSYEVGYMKNPVTEPNLTGGIDSYGVYLASNTLLGPVYLGYSRSSSKERDGRFYLFIGTP